MQSGSAAKYPTLSTDDLCDLRIIQIADKDSVLFLWTPVPLLEDGLRVLQAWGFKYKTKITWRKVMFLGMGWWFRGQVEDMLVGVRGKVKAFRCQHPNFYQCKALKHSQKPDYIRTLIEQATSNMPEPRRLELFATKNYPGWTCLGLEIDEVDIGESLCSLAAK